MTKQIKKSLRAELDAFEAEETRLEEALEAVRDQRREASDRLAEHNGLTKHGLRIGDEIDVTETDWRSRIFKYRMKVTGFSDWLDTGNPEIVGLPYKKDGVTPYKHKKTISVFSGGRVKFKKVKAGPRKATS